MVVRTLQFRAEILIWTILDIVPFLVLFLVWIGMYQGADTVRGYSLTQTINYYLLVIVITTVCDVHFEEWRSKEIKDGKIDFFLIRPLSYIDELLWKDVGGKLTYIVMFFPLCVGFFWWLHQLGLGSLSLAPSQLLAFTFLLLIGYGLNFMIGLWIVLATFWLEGSNGLQHFKWVLITMLSGSLVPLAFMPSWLAKIVETLPLKYLYAVPIGVVQGTYHFTGWDAAYLGLTCVGVWLISRWLWSKALYQYAGAGG